MANEVRTLTGKNLVFSDGSGNIVGCATDVSLAIETEMQQATCAASGPWQENIPKTKSWSGEVSTLYRVADGTAKATNVTIDDLIAKQLTDTPLNVTFQSSESGSSMTDKIVGSVTYTGKAYISSSGLSGGTNADGGGNISFVGTGPLTATAVPTV